MNEPAARLRPFAWHDDVWARILQHQQRNQLGHALLLEGGRGTGRARFAESLARLLLCEAPEAGGNCGRCKACELAANGAHADFLRLVPPEPGKATGIDAVRAAIAFVAGTSTLGKRKVLWCPALESMTLAAFNAFLKCLEEPQGDTVIILTLARGHSIPATVRSRCQQVALESPDAQISGRWLEEQLDAAGKRVDSSVREAVLRATRDRPLQALQILLDEEGTGLAMILALAAMREGSPPEATALEGLARKLAPQLMLELIAGSVQDRLRELPLEALRGREGQRAFEFVEEIQRWRHAIDAGSNPNADLLSFRATQELYSFWAR